MSEPWASVEQAQKEKRCELVIAGPEYSHLIEEHGLDPGIFNVTHLNFLEISKTPLEELPNTIGQLTNLTRLVISYNKLLKLPAEVKNLKKLKFLDVSHNMLSELPEGLSDLSELQSLNASFNNINKVPSVSLLTKLVSLNISHNKFEELPVTICDSNLIHFTDISANNNLISSIPTEIGNISNLKVLDLGENQITCVPGELGSCTKLKELNLKGNKLQDKRLLKLVDQCHVKQIMEYIRSHCPKANAGNDKQSKSKKKAKQSKKAEVEEITELLDELKILHVEDESIKIISTSRIAEIRPYIVCCKVFDVNLSDAACMKKFINLQTKLHDTVCEKRTVATIATHDLSKIQGNLTYDAKSPQEIKITPLNKNKEMSAAKLYQLLNEEADAVRKEKKKNTYSGIHKYLYLLKDKQMYPCLSDSSGLVVSFPPITNSDGSKITSDTKSMLLEVTGNNLNNCKKVMDTLLIDILKLGLGNKKSENEGDVEETQQNTLTVQQVKVVDEEGKLKVIYPSRTDVPVDGILVTRA
ncbi:leucine-rich repeat-containing protein 47 [Parasteatoda tepidariorum]|uniref:leucine-rich repeat-containing protein 47 n=1 Tax=Parasteatoda tepidariorum TaxID=114398 RepID=UPI00077FD19E|nr:leucine-rich repeat-containing protein 47 [Parasteatoda tepidariorum]